MVFKKVCADLANAAGGEPPNKLPNNFEKGFDRPEKSFPIPALVNKPLVAVAAITAALKPCEPFN